MTLLTATGISGGYDRRPVVAGVSLGLSAGRCVAVMGPNGAGKSTLLRLLAGILPLQSGTVELLDRPLASWRRRDVARVVSFVPQLFALTFPLTVRELVEQGRAPHLGPWRPPAEPDRAAVARALARVHLVDQAATGVQNLSGGERQRALLARALATEPRLLLLDEPATALDIRHQLDLVSVLRELLADGVGVVLVVHDWNLALRLADAIVVLDHGAVRAAGSPAEILQTAVLGEVFDVSVEVLHTADGTPFVVPVSPDAAAGHGPRAMGHDPSLPPR
jgi:ABC-type cobalamin/Fe3+-siderophores transport system ATPase subunit